MRRRQYLPGDTVIYRKFKHSAAPGPRARGIEPEPHGEQYDYSVDKFWVVVETRDDSVLLATRRGKRNVVEVHDENLRHARWWEKVLYRQRFPSPDVVQTTSIETEHSET